MFANLSVRDIVAQDDIAVETRARKLIDSNAEAYAAAAATLEALAETAKLDDAAKESPGEAMDPLVRMDPYMLPSTS